MLIYDFSDIADQQRLVALKLMCLTILGNKGGPELYEWEIEEISNPLLKECARRAIRTTRQIWEDEDRSEPSRWQQAALELNPTLSHLFTSRGIAQIQQDLRENQPDKELAIHLKEIFIWNDLQLVLDERGNNFNIQMRCLLANAHLPFTLLAQEPDVLTNINPTRMYRWLAESALGCECWLLLATLNPEFNRQVTPSMLCGPSGSEHEKPLIDALMHNDSGVNIILKMFYECVHSDYQTQFLSLPNVQEWLYTIYYLYVKISVSEVNVPLEYEDFRQLINKKIRTALNNLNVWFREHYAREKERFYTKHSAVLFILDYVSADMERYINQMQDKDEEKQNIFLGKLNAYARSMEVLSKQDLDFGHDSRKDQQCDISESRRGSSFLLLIYVFNKSIESFYRYAKSHESNEFVKNCLNLFFKIANNLDDLGSSALINHAPIDLYGRICYSMFKLTFLSISEGDQERLISEYVSYREKLTAHLKRMGNDILGPFNRKDNALLTSDETINLFMQSFRAHRTNCTNTKFNANIKRLILATPLEKQPLFVLINKILMLAEKLNIEGNKLDKSFIEEIKNILSRNADDVMYFFLQYALPHLYADIAQILEKNVVEPNKLHNISLVFSSFYNYFSNSAYSHLYNLSTSAKKLQFLNFQRFLMRLMSANIKDWEFCRKILANIFISMQLIVSERMLTRFGYLLYESSVIHNSELNNLMKRLYELCIMEIATLELTTDSVHDTTAEDAKSFFNQLVYLFKNRVDVNDIIHILNKMPERILGRDARKLPEMRHWVHLTDNDGLTAWQVAVKYGHKEAAQWLIQQGCILIEISKPENPLEQAAEAEQPEETHTTTQNFLDVESSLKTDMVTVSPLPVSLQSTVTDKAATTDVSLSSLTETLHKIAECAVSLLESRNELYHNDSEDEDTIRYGLLVVSKMRIILFHLMKIQEISPETLPSLLVGKRNDPKTIDLALKGLARCLNAPNLFTDHGSSGYKFLRKCSREFVKFAKQNGTVDLFALRKRILWFAKPRLSDVQMWNLLVARVREQQQFIVKGIDSYETLYVAILQVFYFLRDNEWGAKTVGFKELLDLVQEYLPALQTITAQDAQPLMDILQKQIYPAVNKRLVSEAPGPAGSMLCALK